MNSTFYDKNAKLWKGPEVLPIYNPKLSLAQVLFRSLTAHGPKIAQISDDSGIEVSFDEIRIRTIRAARNLQQLGYEPKQVFGFIAKNSHHVAPIIFASLSIGCPVSTLDTSFKKAEIVHILGATKPVLMFCDVENYDLVKECLLELRNDAKIFTFGGAKGDSEPIETLFKATQYESYFVPITVDGTEDISVIVCSSGSTGTSKGVCLSHAALLEAIDQMNVCDSTDVMFSFSSLYWLSGVLVLLTGTLNGATRIITTDNFSPELQFRLIKKYKITFFNSSPHNLLLITKSDAFATAHLSSCKYILTGGGRVPSHVKTAINQKLPNGNVHVCYGMSETSGAVTIEYPESTEKETSGKLFRGVCIKIIDDEGNRCGPNIDGEICIKTIYRFLGYYGNQEETNDFFDNEGFILSGDVGHFDESGCLFAVDRKKELLKYCGFQIPPSKIEVLLTGSPDIQSACVVGIPDETGDLPAAVVVRSEGSDITEENIFDMVADNFADYCKLRGGVYFVNSLPTAPSGKVIRRTVREIATKLFNLR